MVRPLGCIAFVSRGVKYTRVMINRGRIQINVFCFPANCKVCFVALVQSFSHYNVVGQKLVSPSDLCAEVLSEWVCHACTGVLSGWAPLLGL